MRMRVYKARAPLHKARGIVRGVSFCDECVFTSNLLLFEGGMAEKPVDFGSLSSATEAGNASIHGVVAAVSPMKRGGKTEYFEAKITDGEGQMRVVGFSGYQRKRMASFEEKVESVVIENCQVKSLGDRKTWRFCFDRLRDWSHHPRSLRTETLRR